MNKNVYYNKQSCPVQDVKRYPSGVRHNSRKVLRASGLTTKHFERFYLSFNKQYKY